MSPWRSAVKRWKTRDEPVPDRARRGDDPADAVVSGLGQVAADGSLSVLASHRGGFALPCSCRRHTELDMSCRKLAAFNGQC